MGYKLNYKDGYLTIHHEDMLYRVKAPLKLIHVLKEKKLPYFVMMRNLEPALETYMIKGWKKGWYKTNDWECTTALGERVYTDITQRHIASDNMNRCKNVIKATKAFETEEEERSYNYWRFVKRNAE